MSLVAAMRALADSAQPPPVNIMPLMLVDDRSLAVVIGQPDTNERLEGAGAVIRWHLDDIPSGRQGALLDLDAYTYVMSVVEETAARDRGLQRIRTIAERYSRDYQERGARPKSHVERPVQLACQNVIIGLAAFAHDSSFDGLRVPAWQTCEVPHVATHEANRALSALMLCDAYAAGGTMEVSFETHAEATVPASLRRYARTVGVDIAAQAQGLTPSQSRELFLAVTPMPADLRRRVQSFISSGADTPERLCFTLMAQVWREIELDFLLAVTSRASSILSGGAAHFDRPSRMAESEVCRAALLAGMAYRRLNNIDTAGRTGEARVFEDKTVGVTWRVLPEEGAVLFSGLREGPLPWQPPGSNTEPSDGALVVVPRAHPNAGDVVGVEDLHNALGIPTALLVPADRADLVDCDAPVLRCPDRLSELDTAIEAKLLTARISRA